MLWDATFPKNFHDLIEYEAGDAFLNGLFWTSQGLVTLKKHRDRIRSPHPFHVRSL
jgi:hypothetical protein